MTDNLGIADVVDGTGVHHMVNDQRQALDAAITDSYALNVAGGNKSITGAQWRQHAAFIVSGATVAGRTVTVPAVKRWAYFVAANANTQDFAVKLGSSTVTVPAFGGVTLVYCDGTSVYGAVT